MALDIMNPTCIKQVNKTGTFGIIEADRIDNRTLYNADSDFWGIFDDDKWTNLGDSNSYKVNDPIMVEWGGRLYYGLGEAVYNNFRKNMYEYDISTGVHRSMNNLSSLAGLKDSSYCIKSGIIYIYGGMWTGSSGTSKRLYAYDISGNSGNGSTSEKVMGPFGVEQHTAIIYGDDMYIFGGDINGYIYKYNIPTNTWGNVSDLASAPVGLWYHTATLINDDIYFHGGYVEGNGEAGSPGTLNNRLLVYNITTDTWLEKTPGPYLKEGCSAVVDGKLYITGDIIVDGYYTNEIHMYNPDTDIWIKCLSGGIPASSQAGYTQVGDKIYMYAGVNPSKENNIKSFDVSNFALAIRKVKV